ncbi:respiratory nitrate reductase subunit gamma [Vibrio tritonius]|uniref:respiratory nitrate reductase subunit gamma n=1 Tax=Vibrio tritonius TaxID=1435069 RepID=UPI00083880BA|nr:respiratory nitrate reductase subunit gamma [Vibrio tritonius]
MLLLNELLFGVYPYIAVVVFLIGSWLRYDYGQYSWRAGSSQLLDNHGMHIASNLFHIGIIGVLGGHAFGMLTPHWVYAGFLSIALKQKLAMFGGGFFGLLTLIGGLLLLKRRLYNPRVRASSSFADIFILLLLVVQVSLGLLTIPFSAHHMDGSEMLKFMEWAQAVVYFRDGAAEHLIDVAWVFKLHIILGMTLFVVFPFCRLVHVWSVPVEYITRRYQVVRSRR